MCKSVAQEQHTFEHLNIQVNCSICCGELPNPAKNPTKNLTIKILIVKIFCVLLVFNIEKNFTKPLTNAFSCCIFAA